MRHMVVLACFVGAAACDRPSPTMPTQQAAAVNAMTGINVLLKQPATTIVLNDLATIGPVVDQIPSIDVVTIRATAADLDAVRSKSYVAAAEVDLEVRGGPVRTL